MYIFAESFIYEKIIEVNCLIAKTITKYLMTSSTQLKKLHKYFNRSSLVLSKLVEKFCEECIKKQSCRSINKNLSRTSAFYNVDSCIKRSLKLLIVLTICIMTNVNSLVQAQRNVIYFDETNEESSFNLNVDLFSDSDFSSPLPQNHNFTTADVVYIQVILTIN